MSSPAVTPILRWAGSKRKTIDRLAAYWTSSYSRYVEPFAGCAALFFKLQPKKAVLADLNQALIETYRVLREYPDDLHRECQLFHQPKRSIIRCEKMPTCLGHHFDELYGSCF